MNKKKIEKIDEIKELTEQIKLLRRDLNHGVFRIYPERVIEREVVVNGYVCTNCGQWVRNGDYHYCWNCGYENFR